MSEIAIIFKALNLYAHAAHNLASKSLFLQDHDFLAELYDKYDSEYDSVIERMIGLGQPVDLKEINREAVDLFASLDLTVSENIVFFQKIVELESLLLQAIKQEYALSSIGTQQLIGEQANQAEMRLYKLKQRTKR